MADKPPDKVTLDCSEKEKKIIELMRRMDFGEIRIIVQSGSPIRIEEIKKSIKLEEHRSKTVPTGRTGGAARDGALRFFCSSPALVTRGTGVYVMAGWAWARAVGERI